MKWVNRQELKNLLGQIPLTAEAYWHLRQPGKPVTPEFTLDRLEEAIVDWRLQVLGSPHFTHLGHSTHAPGRKKVFIFGTLRYWLEHTSLLAMALAGLGHNVTLSYLPYARWQVPIDRFNLRRQNLYAESLLAKALPLFKTLPLLNQPKVRTLPSELIQSIELVSLRDTQYTLMVEQVRLGSDLHRLRLQRNRAAASAAFAYLSKERPDVAVIPNGTILEFGVLYQVARFLGIPVVTYEFGEQRNRMWLALDAEVMRQDTNDLWQARKGQTLTHEQLNQMRTLFNVRQRASVWENFARRWQGAPSEGGEQVRLALGLDQRPVVLLATNVIGDSLTLGRQVFSDSMTDWLERTVRYFATHPAVQLVVRIHPGELIARGPSVADLVHKALPSIPEHIHLVPADSKVNTYGIVDLADIGLVYTTTVGMEMAMNAIPVIVVGNTHYRSKGFTLDPDSWVNYFDLLTRVLSDPIQHRLSPQVVELAWNYAYRFFFEYPQPFPWHITQIWKDVKTWPLSRVLSDEGLSAYDKTFSYLVGEPIHW